MTALFYSSPKMKLLAHISNLGVKVQPHNDRLVEYNEVFANTLQAISKIKPDCIVVTHVYQGSNYFSAESFFLVHTFLTKLTSVAKTYLFSEGDSRSKLFPSLIPGVISYELSSPPFKILSNRQTPHPSALLDSNWLLVCGSDFKRELAPLMCDPGSLVQQGFHCAGREHGFNLWQLSDDYLPTASPQFIPIQTSWGYVVGRATLAPNGDLNMNLTPPLHANFPENWRIRYYIDDPKITTQQIENFHNALKSTKPNCVQMRIIGENTPEQTPIPDDPAPQHLTDLGEEILKLLPEHLHTIHLQMLTQMNPPLDLVINKIGEPQTEGGLSLNSITFQNVLSYPDKPTTIDLTKMTGLILITGLNASGKSNIFQIIKWTLFGLDRGSRGFKNMHTQSNQVCMQATFTLHGEQYSLVRRINVSTDGKPTYVEASLTRLRDSYPIVSGKGVQKLDSEVALMIGTCDQFEKSCFYDSRGELPFIHDTPRRSCETILSFCKLTQLNRLQVKAKEIRKQIADSLTYQERHIISLNQQIQQNQTNQTSKADLQNIELLIRSNDTQLELYQSRHDQLRVDIIDLERKIQANQSTTQEYLSLLTSLNLTPQTPPPQPELAKVLWVGPLLRTSTYDLDLAYKAAIHHSIAPIAPPSGGASMQQFPVSSLIQTVQGNYEDTRRQIVLLKAQQSAAFLPFSSLQFTLQTHVDTNLPITPTECKTLLANLASVQSSLSDAQYATRASTIQQLVHITSSLEEAKYALGVMRYQFETIQFNKRQEQLNRLNELKSAALNQELEQQLQQKREELRQLTTVATDLTYQTNRLKEHYYREMALSERGQTELDQLQLQQAQLVHEIEQGRLQLELYDEYILALSPSGIPIRIMEGMIVHIENSINQILSRMSELKIKLTLLNGEQTLIITEIVKNHLILERERISGYERFIMQFAIKFALSSIGIVQTPRFLCIDEGLDCIDQENWPKVVLFFQSLCRTIYHHIFVITHLTTSELASASVNNINVHVNGTYSQITFPP